MDYTDRLHQVSAGVRLRAPVIDVSLILSSVNLEKYTSFFVSAGFRLVDSHERKTDAEIDSLLFTV